MPLSDRFDPDKDAKNITKHKISLVRAFDMDVRFYIEDDRLDYGEVRYRAWGYLDEKPHYLAFTMREGQMRPISLHRVHRKDIRRYVKETEI